MSRQAVDRLYEVSTDGRSRKFASGVTVRFSRKAKRSALDVEYMSFADAGDSDRTAADKDRLVRAVAQLHRLPPIGDDLTGESLIAAVRRCAVQQATVEVRRDMAPGV